MLNGMIVNNVGSCPSVLLIVSSPFKVYIACQTRLFSDMEAMARRLVLIRENTADARRR
jgi:hypothetical protein